jgi:hypothetical protein
MKKLNKKLNNYYIFIQFEIRIIFENEMQNLVKSINLKTILSYSWKINTNNVMYWKNYMYF